MKKGLKIIIVVVVAIILVSTAFLVLYHPSNTTTFTDTSQTTAPEELDPATGFCTSNGPLFAAVFQTLVVFNGSSTTSVVPLLASHVYNTNDTNYTFDIHSSANFSNGQQLNASSVWFSFERGILMGQGPYSSDYCGILFNGTIASETGIYIANGTINALESAGYTITGNLSTRYVEAGSDLADLLTHFNYNSTEMKVMEYKNQALVVNSNDNITINTVHKYSFLLADIAGWWGDIVEPSYVDAHDGVKVNTANSYTDANGIVGSGPYIISSVGKGLSTIVLKTNPHYWVTSAMISNGSVTAMATPATIKTVVINYGLSHADRVEDFDKGISQISTVGASSFKSTISGFHIKSARNSSLIRSYKMPGVYYISFNERYNYTNNIHFREALYDAMNYSALLSVFDNNYNGTPEAYAELGPLSPVYGNSYYNPDNLPLPTMNISASIQNLTIAGKEIGFYVVLPNGTHIGASTGIDISTHTFTITGIAPLTAAAKAQLAIAIVSFASIGLKFASTSVTSSVEQTYTTSTSTPQFRYIYWEPDYLDPIGQQLISVFDAADGGTFGGNSAWVNNATLQTYFSNLDFLNSSTQIHEMKSIEKIVYDQYAYAWMPMPNQVFFVAPDVHGFIYNVVLAAYFYNLITVSGKLTGSIGYMTIYTLVADIEIAIGNTVPKF